METTQEADTTETPNSPNTMEEDNNDSQQNSSAPQTPPRRLRQAAIYILNKVRWEDATDGTIMTSKDGPATLQVNYYAALRDETRGNIPKQKGRLALRPELLHYGRDRLKRPYVNHTRGIYSMTPAARRYLQQNATKLTMADVDKKDTETEIPTTTDTTTGISTATTQTPDTVTGSRYLSRNRTISFLSNSTTGLIAPTILPETDSDSSTKIEQRSFIAGSPCESNAESAERHKEIQRNVERKKKRRNKRRRKLTKRLQLLLESQLMEESAEDRDTSSSTLPQCVQTLTIDDINPHDLYPHQDKPISKQPIDLLYDTGASITMLPLDYAPAWKMYDYVYTN